MSEIPVSSLAIRSISDASILGRSLISGDGSLNSPALRLLIAEFEGYWMTSTPHLDLAYRICFSTTSRSGMKYLWTQTIFSKPILLHISRTTRESFPPE